MHKRFSSVDTIINEHFRSTVYDGLTYYRLRGFIGQKKILHLTRLYQRRHISSKKIEKILNIRRDIYMYSGEYVRGPRSYWVIENVFSKCDWSRFWNFKKPSWIANRTWKCTRCVNNVTVVKVARVIHCVTTTTRTYITIISSIFYGFFISDFLKLFRIQSKTTNNNQNKCYFYCLRLNCRSINPHLYSRWEGRAIGTGAHPKFFLIFNEFNNLLPTNNLLAIRNYWKFKRKIHFQTQ